MVCEAAADGYSLVPRGAWEGEREKKERKKERKSGSEKKEIRDFV